MEYTEFLETVRDCLLEKVGDDVSIVIQNVVKNNNIHMSGLNFKKKGVNAAPTIYMGFYYDMYNRGEDILKIADSVLETYSSYALKEDYDITSFVDYEKAKGKLLVKLVNYEKNRRLLEDVPHEKFYDLAIVPYYSIENPNFGKATIMIKNDHLKIWKVDSFRVMTDAINNTSKKEYSVSPITEVIRDECPDIDLDKCFTDDIPMYVVTNEERTNGAVFMIMTNRLRSIRECMDSDFYIIPSSIHEIIVFRKSGCEDVDELNKMVKEVNATQVSEDEVLSDHVYLFTDKSETLIF